MKVLLIGRKQLLSMAAVVLGLSLTLALGSAVWADNNRRLPIYCVDTDEKKIAVSFDAAWGSDDTDRLIEILNEYQVPATFFVVGGWVDKYPEEVKKLAEAGHQVMNHSNTHPYMTKLSVTQMIDEIESCNRKIEAVTGVRPTLLRPPYGDYNNALVSTVEEQGMRCIQWSVDSLDWQDSATKESIYKRVTEKVCPGSIVLFHNDADHTPEALPKILEQLKNDGYEFVLISDLIYGDSTVIDHTGKQCRPKA